MQKKERIHMIRKLFGKNEGFPSRDWDGVQRITPMPEPDPEPRLPAPWSTSGLIYQDETGDLSVNMSSIAEAKLVKKDAKLRQRELRTEKRALTTAMQEIRARYRQKTATRDPSVRGMGNFGRALRTMDQYSRAADRNNREQELAPYETAKAKLDHQIYLLDRLVNTIDARMHELEGSQEAA